MNTSATRQVQDSNIVQFLKLNMKSTNFLRALRAHLVYTTFEKQVYGENYSWQ